MLKAICMGRISYEVNLTIDKMPDEGSVNEFFDKGGTVGGTAAAIGCCLARWGVAAAIAGVLGNDVWGTRIRKVFDSMHIDTRYIEPSYDNDTSLSVVLINKSTGKHTTYNLSDKYISLKKCDFDFTPDVICVDGYDSVQAKNLLERYPHALSVLDASLITQPVIELLRKAKYVICTKEFAESVTGVKVDFQQMETLVQVYQRLKKKYLNTEFVITLGEKGALYCINNQIKISPSLKVNVVDTHGCGTIFRAAFAHTLVNGGDLEKAVKMGCIAAGLCAEKVGTTDAIPTLEEMKKLYEQNY
ncbi:MAG: bifunctional hydroxymethylpyrimidine kinase/phosphomethylpyrimidine kinase [Bacilli bacterium]|nr:bifunctional hydroxymethylpyrimidine kinase/phosphomethylpyrimidine kinase [Bacilli bacterium]